MKGFYIEIANNLLEPKHRKKMGTAIWEFMWCLDKITRIDEDGKGWVLGGKPINLKDIKKELGGNETWISERLNKLKKEGYLELLKTPYGLVIKVWKAKKSFKQTRNSFKQMPKANIRHKQDNNNNDIINSKNIKRYNDLKQEILKERKMI